MVGAEFLLLAVLIGAFGAHGLKDMMTPERLVTFETGNRYQFYHGFALLFLGLLGEKINIKYSAFCFSLGITLFSFNCYFYAVSSIKFYAMLVPIGGVLFLIGWGLLIKELYTSRRFEP